ncbi:hypothetical protein JKP88DRAFT_336884 [Tribonema minus]|uniref:Uncharacterized protein n=1 Tax=Tribonema minus TaxID=303371 RepID=A0A836C930_9STRA|nr:hypothetical protein JKP88DRAFT_336884 [Tribonema minus]
MVSLSRCAGLLSLLMCTMSSSSAAEPTGNGGSEVQPGAGDRFNKLAAKGDWYKDSNKTVRMSIEKGDVNGSNICSGKFASMNIRLTRYSSDRSDSDKCSESSVSISYRRGMWRDCEPDETSTSTYGGGYYGFDKSCCSDTLHLTGYTSVPEVGIFRLGLKDKLITAVANIEVPLDQTSSSSSGDNTGGTIVTAKVSLQMDCVNVINRHNIFAGDFCLRGDCVSSTGEQDINWCATAANTDDAVLTGTIELTGDVKLKVDLAAPPTGYTVSARADFEADKGKVVG